MPYRTVKRVAERLTTAGMYLGRISPDAACRDVTFSPGTFRIEIYDFGENDEVTHVAHVLVGSEVISGKTCKDRFPSLAPQLVKSAEYVVTSMGIALKRPEDIFVQAPLTRSVPEHILAIPA